MRSKRMTKFISNRTILSIVLLLFLSLLMAGCSNQETAGNAELAEPAESVEPAEPADGIDESEEAIRTVIEKEFNGPDEKYRELWGAVEEEWPADPSEEEYNAFLESPVYTELTTYTEETYAEYFTDNGYDNFVRANPAFNYSHIDGDYEMSTSDIEIVQSDNGDTLYSFTFKVLYEPEGGEAGEYDFEGRAIAPEEGKIGKIQFNDKDWLIEDLRETRE